MNNAQTSTQNWILEIIKDNALSITLLVFSTIVTLLNIFAFVKLAPIMQRIELLENKAHATELESDKQQSINEQIIRIESTVSDIERRTGRIEDKRSIDSSKETNVYTSSEAAKLLNIKVEEVRSLSRTLKIGKKVSGRYIYTEEDIIKFKNLIK